MKYAYSPDTGEFINVEVPADWMLATELAPPAFDPQKEGCFFRNGAWEIVTSQPDTTQLAKDARSYRNALIAAAQQRIDRALRQARNGSKPSDDITKLDVYVQALADVPNQKTFPTAIEWPTL